MRNFLGDPQIKDIAASIGINFEQDRVGQHILDQWRKIMYRAQNTTNKNHRISNDRHAMLKSLAVAAVKTPPKNITNTDQSNPNNSPKERVSKSAISPTLGFNNLSTGLRNLKKAEIKRAQIADDDKDGWCMINEAEEKHIHSAEYLDKVEEWIKNNEKVKISPRMKDTLIKRDRKGRKVLHEDTLGAKTYTVGLS